MIWICLGPEVLARSSVWRLIKAFNVNFDLDFPAWSLAGFCIWETWDRSMLLGVPTCSFHWLVMCPPRERRERILTSESFLMTFAASTTSSNVSEVTPSQTWKLWGVRTECLARCKKARLKIWKANFYWYQVLINQFRTVHAIMKMWSRSHSMTVTSLQVVFWKPPWSE